VLQFRATSISSSRSSARFDEFWCGDTFLGLEMIASPEIVFAAAGTHQGIKLARRDLAPYHIPTT